MVLEYGLNSARIFLRGLFLVRRFMYLHKNTSFGIFHLYRFMSLRGRFLRDFFVRRFKGLRGYFFA